MLEEEEEEVPSGGGQDVLRRGLGQQQGTCSLHSAPGSRVEGETPNV